AGGRARDDGGRFAVIHVPDVGEAEGLPEGRADGRVGQDVETEPSIALDPLRVHQRASGDTQARAQELTEEPAAGPRREVADPREHRCMRIVPLIGAVEAIGAVSNRTHTPFLLATPATVLVYNIPRGRAY